MDERIQKERLARNNWRAHVDCFVMLRKKNNKHTPEEYCNEQGLDYEAFQKWLEFVPREDEVSFYYTFSDIQLSRANKSLNLLKKYVDIQELQEPLMRDAIVAYGSLFRPNKSRTGGKGFSLRGLEPAIPDRLKQTHDKILEHRDTVVAHCDLGPRNPRVSILGIGFKMAGYCWQDYQKLISVFEEILSFVQRQLKEHNVKKDLYKQLIRDFEEHPISCLEDPGPPRSTDGSI